MPRRPFLGLRPGAQRRRAGGGLASVPPLLGPAHKEPHRGPAPAPRPGPQRERPRRRRTGPGPDPGGRAGGREASAPRPRRRWRRGRRRQETDISFELKWSRFRSDHWPKRDTNLQCSPGWLPSPIGCLVGQKMAAKEPVPARSSASSTRPPLPPPRAASLGAAPSLRASRALSRPPRPRPGPAPAEAPPGAPEPRGRPCASLQSGPWATRGGSGGAAACLPCRGFQGPGSRALLRFLRACFPRSFPRPLRSVISQVFLFLKPPPSPTWKCLTRLSAACPRLDFLRRGNQGQKPPARATPELLGGFERQLAPGTPSAPRVFLVHPVNFAKIQRSL